MRRTGSTITVALAVLAFGGLGFYLRATGERATGERAASSGSPSASTAPPALPSIALAEKDAKRIVRIDLTQPDDDDKSKTHTITLEKLDGDWEVTSPLKTRASHT